MANANDGSSRPIAVRLDSLIRSVRPGVLLHSGLPASCEDVLTQDGLIAWEVGLRGLRGVVETAIGPDFDRLASWIDRELRYEQLRWVDATTPVRVLWFELLCLRSHGRRLDEHSLLQWSHNFSSAIDRVDRHLAVPGSGIPRLAARINDEIGDNRSVGEIGELLAELSERSTSKTVDVPIEARLLLNSADRAVIRRWCEPLAQQ